MATTTTTGTAHRNNDNRVGYRNVLVDDDNIISPLSYSDPNRRPRFVPSLTEGVDVEELHRQQLMRAAAASAAPPAAADPVNSTRVVRRGGAKASSSSNTSGTTLDAEDDFERLKAKTLQTALGRMVHVQSLGLGDLGRQRKTKKKTTTTTTTTTTREKLAVSDEEEAVEHPQTPQKASRSGGLPSLLLDDDDPAPPTGGGAAEGLVPALATPPDEGSPASTTSTAATAALTPVAYTPDAVPSMRRDHRRYEGGAAPSFDNEGAAFSSPPHHVESNSMDASRQPEGLDGRTRNHPLRGYSGAYAGQYESGYFAADGGAYHVNDGTFGKDSARYDDVRRNLDRGGDYDVHGGGYGVGGYGGGNDSSAEEENDHDVTKEEEENAADDKDHNHNLLNLSLSFSTALTNGTDRAVNGGYGVDDGPMDVVEELGLGGQDVLFGTKGSAEEEEDEKGGVGVVGTGAGAGAGASGNVVEEAAEAGVVPPVDSASSDIAAAAAAAAASAVRVSTPRPSAGSSSSSSSSSSGVPTDERAIDLSESVSRLRDAAAAAREAGGTNDGQEEQLGIVPSHRHVLLKARTIAATTETTEVRTTVERHQQTDAVDAAAGGATAVRYDRAKTKTVETTTPTETEQKRKSRLEVRLEAERRIVARRERRAVSSSVSAGSAGSGTSGGSRGRRYGTPQRSVRGGGDARGVSPAAAAAARRPSPPPTAVPRTWTAPDDGDGASTSGSSGRVDGTAGSSSSGPTAVSKSTLASTSLSRVVSARNRIAAVGQAGPMASFDGTVCSTRALAGEDDESSWRAAPSRGGTTASVGGEPKRSTAAVPTSAESSVASAASSDDQSVGENSEGTPEPRPIQSAPTPSPKPGGDRSMGDAAVTAVPMPELTPSSTDRRVVLEQQPMSMEGPDTPMKAIAEPPSSLFPSEQSDHHFAPRAAVTQQQPSSTGADISPENNDPYDDSTALREFMDLRRRLIVEGDGKRGGASKQSKSKDPPGTHVRSAQTASKGRINSRSSARSIASSSVLSNISEGATLPSMGVTDVLEDGPQLNTSGLLEVSDDASRTSSVMRLEDRLDKELDRRERERKQRDSSMQAAVHSRGEQTPVTRPVEKENVDNSVPALMDLSDELDESELEAATPQQLLPQPHQMPNPAPQIQGSVAPNQSTTKSLSTESSPLVGGSIPTETDHSSMASMSASDWNSMPRTNTRTPSPSGLHNSSYLSSVGSSTSADSKGPREHILPDRQMQIADFVDEVLDSDSNAVVLNKLHGQPAPNSSRSPSTSTNTKEREVIPPASHFSNLCVSQPSLAAPQRQRNEDKGTNKVRQERRAQRKEQNGAHHHHHQRSASAQRRRAEFDEISEYDEREWKERDEVSRIAEQEYVEELRRRLPRSEKRSQATFDSAEIDSKHRDGRKRRSKGNKSKRSRSAPPRNKLAPSSLLFRAARSTSSSKLTVKEEQAQMEETIITLSIETGQTTPSQSMAGIMSSESVSVSSATSSVEIAECISDTSPRAAPKFSEQHRRRSKSQPSQLRSTVSERGEESTFTSGPSDDRSTPTSMPASVHSAGSSTFMSVHTEERMFPSGDDILNFLSASSIPSSYEEGTATATSSSSDDLIAFLSRSSVPSDSDGCRTTDNEGGTMSTNPTKSTLPGTDDGDSVGSPLAASGRDSPTSCSTTSSVEIAECVSDISPPPLSLTKKTLHQKNTQRTRSQPEPYYARQSSTSRLRKDKVSEVARSLANPLSAAAEHTEQGAGERQTFNAVFEAATEDGDEGVISMVSTLEPAPSPASAPSPPLSDENGIDESRISTPSLTSTDENSLIDSGSSSLSQSGDKVGLIRMPTPADDHNKAQFVDAGDHMDGSNAAAAEHVERGEYDKALSVFGKVLHSHTSRYGENHPFVASTYHNIGIVHAKSARSQTNPADAERRNRDALLCFQSAARIARDSLGTEHPNVAVSLVRIGFLLLSMGQHENALITFKEALRIRTASLGTNHALASKIHNNIGVTNLYLGNFDESKKAFEQALDIQRNVLSRVQVDCNGGRVGKEFLHRAKLEVADTLCNIGTLCLNWTDQRELPVQEEKTLIWEAIDSFSEAHALRSAVLGPDHPLTNKIKHFLATAHNTLEMWNANSADRSQSTLQGSDSDSMSAQRRGCNMGDLLNLNAMCRYATGYVPSPETLKAIEEANCRFDEPRLDTSYNTSDGETSVSVSPLCIPKHSKHRKEHLAQDREPNTSSSRSPSSASLSKKTAVSPETRPLQPQRNALDLDDDEESCLLSTTSDNDSNPSSAVDNQNERRKLMLISPHDNKTHHQSSSKVEVRSTTTTLEESGGYRDLDGDGLTFPGGGDAVPKHQPRTVRDVKEMLESPDTHLNEVYALAAAYVDRNEYTQAANLFQTLVESHKKTHGPMHPLVGSALHNLGVVNLRGEKYHDALDAFNAAIVVRSHIAKESENENPDVAISLVKKGVCNLLLKKFEVALVSFNTALSIRRRTLGDLHPSTARVYNNIGCVHVEFNRLRQARDAFESALEVQRKALRDDPESLPLMFGASTTLCNLGYIYKLKGLHDKSAVILREALALQERVLGKYHPNVLATLDSLAEANARNNDCVEAIRCYNTLLVRFSGSEDTSNYSQGTLSQQQRRSSSIAVYKISRVHMKQNDYEAALRKLKEALFYVRGLGDATLEAKFQAEVAKVEKQLEATADMAWI